MPLKYPSDFMSPTSQVFGKLSLIYNKYYGRTLFKKQPFSKWVLYGEHPFVVVNLVSCPHDVCSENMATSNLLQINLKDL